MEYLASAVSGDLAYTVGIERSVVRLAGETADAPMVLRVTHVFRRDAGAWRVFHRHAEPLVYTNGSGDCPAAEMMRWLRVT